MHFRIRTNKFFWVVTLSVLFLTATTAFAVSDKYRLVWTDDPATTMTIGWCQNSGSPLGVDYGTDPALSMPATNNAVTTRLYDNSAHPEGAAFDNYFVTLTALAPDTAYYFRIVDTEGAGDIMWFKTAPDTPQPFTFISGGDSRTIPEPRVWGNQLVSKIRPLFIAHGGDYEDDVTNAEMANWLDEWSEHTRSSDGRMYPIIPAHGNHENDMINFVELIFNMPNPDAYYAMNIGGSMMRMYTLNTELEPGVGYGAFTGQDAAKWNAQRDWLATDMAANPGYIWKVANYHRPLRPHQGGKPEGLGRIDAWAQTFYDNGLDLAVECDSHMAKYTFPVAPCAGVAGCYESFIRDDAGGTMFIGEGSWGAPHRANDDDKPWTLSSDTFWQFNVVQASPSELIIRKVKFGQYDAANNPVLDYNMGDIAELTQAEQDADPFALPIGLDIALWKPLAGEVVTLPFAGADVDNVEYVSTGGTWKYLDDGSDQGTVWTDPTFDDSTWATGDAQLGYGDGDETTVIASGGTPGSQHITNYFRKEFTVSDAAQVIKLKLMLLRDDGAVVYINGNEAIRSSMPDGPITYTTRANDAGDENKYYEYNLDPALLVTGDNLAAVEVHQSGPTSSDTSFDMVLYGIESQVLGVVPAAPTLLAEAGVTTSSIDISWTDNATDEVGYELWRSVAGGAWEIYEPSLNAGTTSFADIMLSEGTDYTYKVRAYNAAGLSAFSNELTVTTLKALTPVVYAEDFNMGTFGQFTPVNVASNKDWHMYEYPTGSGEWFARMNGYGGDTASDDWLISPALNLYAYEGEYVLTDLAYNYGGPELEVLFSDNYDTNVHTDPEDANWIVLPAAMPSSASYTWETTGELGFDFAAVDFDDNTFGLFSTYSVTSNADWAIETRADKLGVVANGFGADGPSDDWLISPALTVGAGSQIEIAFNLYRKYGGPELTLAVSTDYAGSGDPTLATWHSYVIPHNDIYDAWKFVAITHEFAVDATAYVAFRYTSDGTGPGDGARLGVDDVVIQPTQVHVAFHYISTGTGGGDGRIWEVDNFQFRANRVSFASEDFNQDQIADSTFATYSAASNADWGIEERGGQQGAIANGYGADGPSDDWLISPPMNIAPSECVELVFDFYYKYSGPELEVMVSTDYSGSDDPAAASWDAVTIPYDQEYADAWKPITVDLCNYSGTVYVAFRYTSTGTGPGDGARIGVDNVQVVRKTVSGLTIDFTANPTTVVTHDAAISYTAYVSGGTAPYIYAWNFGDGGVSSEENPIYSYSTAGTYTVELCVTDADSVEVCNNKTDLISVQQGTFFSVPAKMGDLRMATFNASMFRSNAGELAADLTSGADAQIRKVAEIIQRISPDVILINEFDYDETGQSVADFKANYLEVGRNGAEPILFPYHFVDESNTGIPSGMDYNNDGDTEDPEDAYGYGAFPGQYGMLLLSKFPIDLGDIRTFQKFRWKHMPGNLMPKDYYDRFERRRFRLSSKSHWDVPVLVDGEIVHVLCSHPTPPVFDDGDAAQGAVDWNGRRNHDEIRFWADYVTPKQGKYIYDDARDRGGLEEDDRFVILGDQNADPNEGDSYDTAINQLLNNVYINNFIPTSAGAVDSGLDADDTASWGMRVDYNLPSAKGLTVEQGAVFWPIHTDDIYYLTEADGSSDHRLVWLDLSLGDHTQLTLEPLANFQHGTEFDKGAAEISAYDPWTKKLFVVNGEIDAIDVLDISKPSAPVLLESLDLGGAPNSVTVKNRVMIVAFNNEIDGLPGKISMYSTRDYRLLNTLDVGVVPDMVIVTPNAKKILVANEGEPEYEDGLDPEGSISIIDVSRGVRPRTVRRLDQSDVRTLTFDAFESRRDALIAEGVRIFGNPDDPTGPFCADCVTVSQDLEPEFITISSDSSTAWVTLQENNAIAVIDLKSNTIIDVSGLGFKDHNAPGMGMDASDKDGMINIANWPVLGMYQSDAIAAYDYEGETYIVMANEGDERGDEDERVEDLVLDPGAYPDAAYLQEKQNLGRLKVSKVKGDTDADGDFDELFSFGARSFTIRDSMGDVVYDSGDMIEQKIAETFPAYFNCDNDNDAFDDKSDSKGPEVEGVTVGKMDNSTLAFVGLEDMGGVMVFDITNPDDVSFVQYLNDRNFSAILDDEDPDFDISLVGNIGPEGLLFIPEKLSPIDAALLIVSYEVSGSTGIYRVNSVDEDDDEEEEDEDKEDDEKDEDKDDDDDED